jgi:hypothetical protein
MKELPRNLFFSGSNKSEYVPTSFENCQIMIADCLIYRSVSHPQTNFFSELFAITQQIFQHIEINFVNFFVFSVLIILCVLFYTFLNVINAICFQNINWNYIIFSIRIIAIQSFFQIFCLSYLVMSISIDSFEDINNTLLWIDLWLFSNFFILSFIPSMI